MKCNICSRKLHDNTLTGECALCFSWAMYYLEKDWKMVNAYVKTIMATVPKWFKV